MEHVRRYLDNESTSYRSLNVAHEDQQQQQQTETQSSLGSTRIDGRLSDTKSIGSLLSQHLFESDDNEDDKYYGTCNGYSSQPGSKSNLLLCSECDSSRSNAKTCTYRPQTPSTHYARFVEERIEQSQLDIKSNTSTKIQQDRRSSVTAICGIMKSPVTIETAATARYLEDERMDNREFRSKSIPSTSPSGTGRRQQDQKQLELRSPGSGYKRDALKGNERSNRYHSAERTWTKRTEPREEATSQEQHQDSMRSPDRSSWPTSDQRSWTRTRGQRAHEDNEEEQVSEDPDYLEESEESPGCPQCNGSSGSNGGASNGLSRCAHCNVSSDQDDGDLICFRCQMSAEDETTSVEGSVCPKCESIYAGRSGTNGSSTCQTTSSTSSEAGTNKYPVDAVVKIHVNNRSIEIDSDDTVDSETSVNNRDSGDAGSAGSIERLATIVEAKNDTASENGDENGSKINGQPRTKYLNYMIVLLL